MNLIFLNSLAINFAPLGKSLTPFFRGLKKKTPCARMPQGIELNLTGERKFACVLSENPETNCSSSVNSAGNLVCPKMANGMMLNLASLFTAKAAVLQGKPRKMPPPASRRPS